MTATKVRNKAVTVPAYAPKAPDAIMAELWAFKRQANAAANYDIKKLLKRIERETRLCGRSGV
jgi:hypothetical protein